MVHRVKFVHQENMEEGINKYDEQGKNISSKHDYDEYNNFGPRRREKKQFVDVRGGDGGGGGGGGEVGGRGPPQTSRGPRRIWPRRIWLRRIWLRSGKRKRRRRRRRRRRRTGWRRGRRKRSALRQRMKSGGGRGYSVV